MKIEIPDCAQMKHKKAYNQLLYPRGTIESHVRYVEDHVQTIKHILNKSKVTLDIGSGLGIANIFISKIVKAEKIYLLDASVDAEEPLVYKSKNCDAWFDSAIAKEVIRNHVNADVFAISELSSVADESVNLIFSFRAWGYHFPISTYEDEVNRIATDNCLVILNAPREIDANLRGFREIDRFRNSVKYDEVVFKRI